MTQQVQSPEPRRIDPNRSLLNLLSRLQADLDSVVEQNVGMSGQLHEVLRERGELVEENKKLREVRKVLAVYLRGMHTRVRARKALGMSAETRTELDDVIDDIDTILDRIGATDAKETAK